MPEEQTQPQWKNITALLATLATLAATVGLKWEAFAALPELVQLALIAGVALAGIAYVVSDRWLQAQRIKTTVAQSAAPVRGANGQFVRRE